MSRTGIGSATIVDVNDGAAGLRTVHGYLYYEDTTGTEPSAPSGNTYTFSTGVVSGSGIGTGTDTWTNEPRTQDATSTNTFYTVRYYGTETAANSSTISVTYSNVVESITFNGVVTFNGTTFTDGTNSYDTSNVANLSDLPDVSNFLEPEDLGSSGTTVIDGGRIQASSTVTVGTGDNVAILTGSGTDRLFIGDSTPGDAPFRVTQAGVLNATGAIINGNITATSLDVEDATVTGTFIAPIGWSDSVYSGVINRGNLNESVKDLIDERIAEVTGGISGDFGQDDGSFSHIAQGNPDPDNPTVLNITHENGKDLTVELSGSRSWNRQFIGLPDTDMDVTIILERSPAGANTWTTLTTLTQAGSSITTSGPSIIHSSTYAYSISIYHVLADDQASGNYDYRARTTVAGSAYNVSIPLQLTVVEPATVGAGNADTLDNEDGTYYLDYNNFTNTPTIPDVSEYNTSNWDTAYGWGNHADAGYLTSIGAVAGIQDGVPTSAYGEIQYRITGNNDIQQYNSIFAYGSKDVSWDWRFKNLSDSPSVTRNLMSLDMVDSTTANLNVTGTITASGYNNSNWDTAYGWGDHSTQGYLTSVSWGQVTGKPSTFPPSSHNHDDRYYTESEIQTFMDRGYINGHSATNLSIGWYTIATNTGDRATARFGIWDTNSSDHQAVTFYAAHHFGTDTSNTLTVLDNSCYSGNPFRHIRIKDAGTYDGAVLQIYIDDSSNSVNCAILGDNFQSNGWVLCDWIPDATTPPNVSNYGNFAERSKVDLNNIAQGGFATTGDIYAGGDTTQYKVFNDAYHPNADKWTTARTLSLTGDVTGSVSWDGSANASITTTVANDSHSHSNYLPLSGGVLTGSLSVNGGADINIGATAGGDMGDLVWRLADGTEKHRIWDGGTGLQYRYNGSGSNKLFHQGYHPNADKWTTARTLSLTGDVTGSVSWDGSANASITTTVANDSHTHDTRYLRKDGTNQVADSNQFLRVGRSLSSGFCEMRLDNDVDNFIILGSIGSTYSDSRWSSSSYLYADRKLRIKSGADIEFSSGGTNNANIAGRFTASRQFEVDTGSIRSDNEFLFLTKANDAQTAQFGGIGIGSSYATYPAFTGGVNVQNGYQVGGQLVIRNSRDGLLTKATGTTSLTASTGIKQTYTEGWTAIFADFEPYQEWGLYHDNPQNRFVITGGTTTNNIGSFSVTNHSGNTRTAYEKIILNQSDGTVSSGGGYKVGDTTVIDSSRNLTNIASLAVNGTKPSSAQAHISSSIQYALELRHAINSTQGVYYDTLSLLNDTNISGNYTQIGFRTRDSDGQHHRASIQAHRDGSSPYTGILRFKTRDSASNLLDSLTIDSIGDVDVSKGSLQIGGTTVIDSSRNIYNIGTINAGALVNDNAGALRVVNPDGASYATTASTVTGAIKITLPVGVTNTMGRFTVKIYEYSTNESFDVVCGGYNYNGYTWHNCFAYIVGSGKEARNFTVRFGYEGTNFTVYIGETNSTWSYPQVAVTDFMGGYSGYTANNWDNNWQVGFTTSFGTIRHTFSNVEVGIDGYEKRIGGTTVIDSSRNLTNVGHFQNGSMWVNDGSDFNSYNENIRLFNAPNSVSVIGFGCSDISGRPQSSILGFSDRHEVRVGDTDGWTTRTYLNDFRVNGQIRIGDTTVIDSSRNLTSIGSISFNGNMSTTTRLQVTTNYGWAQFGAQNSDWCHIQTDRPSFYFNRPITVDDGIVQSYNEDLILRRARTSSHQMTLNTSGATFTGNVTAYSDITLKDKITKIDNALEKVNAIRGVTYDRIDQDNARHAGVIAQEVEEVLPEVVHTDDNGIKSVAYGNMVGLLIEAIKEQQTQIKELQAQINTLKGEK